MNVYINVQQRVIYNLAFPPLIKRCIFCKSENRIFNREHVFQDSLGNKKIILPLGVVCKSCNGTFCPIESKFVETYPNVF